MPAWMVLDSAARREGREHYDGNQLGSRGMRPHPMIAHIVRHVCNPNSGVGRLRYVVMLG